MTTIKSFSVGTGDMFYIKHGSSNFSIIDCNLVEDEKDKIIKEILDAKYGKEITRFISTHPDEDHLRGLNELDKEIQILNFYCVENKIKLDNKEDFNKYCELRDNSKKCFFIFKDCSRKWMNQSDEKIGSSGIDILWPNTNNEYYKDELKKLEDGKKISYNNISPIIKYSLKDGITALWFGDMENDFLEKIVDEVELPKADIIFAPHHGRDTGKIPKYILDKIEPKLIIIGESKSEYLNYYDGFNTITQNTAKNIVFKCTTGKVDIYTKEEIKCDFLDKEKADQILSTGECYRGTLNLN